MTHVNDALDESMLAELSRRAAQLNYTTVDDDPPFRQSLRRGTIRIFRKLFSHILRGFGYTVGRRLANWC